MFRAVKFMAKAPELRGSSEVQVVFSLRAVFVSQRASFDAGVSEPGGAGPGGCWSREDLPEQWGSALAAPAGHGRARPDAGSPAHPSRHLL